MPWQALVRTFDLGDALAGQAAVAEALAVARSTRGARGPEARALREGFNVLARVLRTGRASIRDLHDVAWIDHTIVGPARGTSASFGTQADRVALEDLASLGGALAHLVPGSVSWTEVNIEAMGEIEPLKLQRGRSGPYSLGLVLAQDAVDLVGGLEAAGVAAPALRPVVDKLRPCAAALLRSATPATILVVAASEGSGP